MTMLPRFGLRATLKFWQQTESLPLAVPTDASIAVFHASWTAVNADLAACMRHTVHA